jgi:hypothetical protein
LVCGDVEDELLLSHQVDADDRRRGDVAAHGNRYLDIASRDAELDHEHPIELDLGAVGHG